MAVKRRLQLVVGIVLMFLTVGAYVWRWDLPLRWALGVAGTLMLGSLGSTERWQGRVAIAVLANTPILIYLLLHRM